MNANATALASSARSASAAASAAAAAFALLSLSAALATLVGLEIGASQRAPHDAIEDSAAAVGSLILHNAAVVLIPFALLALGWERMPGIRHLGDGVVIASLLGNGAVVGYAFARAGLGLAAYLPHLPFEWGAIAIPAGTWFVFRRATPGDPPGLLLRALGASALALVIAAVLEVYAVPVS
jgi:hypothetical protein